MKSNPLGKIIGLAALAASLTLAACGRSEPQPATAPAAAETSAAAAAAPAAPKLYGQTCRNCHGVPGTGAPQAGDAKAWAPRIAQGRETLIDHSINGYKSMPPMGACAQCTEQDFTALIEYMSGTQFK